MIHYLTHNFLFLFYFVLSILSTLSIILNRSHFIHFNLGLYFTIIIISKIIHYFNLRLSISNYLFLISSPSFFITLNQFTILIVHFGSTLFCLLLSWAHYYSKESTYIILDSKQSHHINQFMF